MAERQNDNCAVTLKMEDGSLGTLLYVANGDPHYEKERIEVFGQGRTAVIENFRIARLGSAGKTRTVKPHGTGKGHGNELSAFVQAVRAGGASPVPLDQNMATTVAMLCATESIATGQPVRLSDSPAGR